MAKVNCECGEPVYLDRRCRPCYLKYRAERNKLKKTKDSPSERATALLCSPWKKGAIEFR